ncbi:ubiquinol oxidase subunit II [Sphingomonas bacterium]|uniref:ubiquinol oxidase subunit II n=1 Tax=Sphingomonas bacterium TaxID=1895847 RepID=UPI001575DA2C|nr:ubiquinol oxidase subunit II [Sphingomonas bacterium]
MNAHRQGRGRTGPNLVGIAARLLLPGVALALSGCGIGVLDPVGPVGGAQRTILFDSVGIMLCVVVPVILGTAGIAWWFRASNRRATYRPDFVYSGRIETMIWGIPFLVVLFLGGIAWIGAHELDPAKPLASPAKPLEVEVVSLDWKWLFIYPEAGIASVNRLVLPVGRPVHFRLTSASVFNAFFVPRLGSMIYTMNGMTTQLNLQADRVGRYPGQSSHFSGDGFAGMRFDADAVPPAAFDGWVAHARSAGPLLDRSAYLALARPSSAVAPYAYRAVVPKLFDAIVMHTIDAPPSPAVATARR